jgi:hypothetical protein
VFTWQVPGGNAPRLTTFAYPFYLVAAGVAVWLALRAMVEPAFRERALSRARTVGLRRAVVALAVVLVAGWAAVRGLFFLRTREALAAGREATIAAGPRDALFFDDAWSRPADRGNLSVRTLGPPGGTIGVPLRSGRAHRLLFRMDPADPARVPLPNVRISLNGAALGTVALAYDPDRIGTYEVDAPASAARDGRNAIELVPDAEIALWYVRVVPLPR